MKTGYLAHLAPNNASWTLCIAVLDPPYLTLTPRLSSSSFADELNSSIPVTRLFDLSSCSSTRGISDVRLGPETPQPIVPNYDGSEGDKDNAHVFEIELHGGVREFFASATLKERSAWVSAIWDIVLSRPNQDICLDAISPVLSSPGIDVAAETGTPTMLDGDLRLQPPLRVVNGTASRLSGNSSAYEGTLRNHDERSISLHDAPISPGIDATTSPSAVGSGVTSTSGRLYDHEGSMTGDLLMTSSLTSPTSNPDEEFPFPLPKRLSRSKLDVHNIRTRPGVELNDGDDPMESWRPFNGRTNPPVSTRSFDTAIHNIRYDGVPPSASLSPFARRRMSKNSKLTSASSYSSRTNAFTSASEATGTLTPSTFSTRISQISPDHVITTHQMNPPPLPSKDQDFPFPPIHRVTEQTTVPTRSENESRHDNQNPDLSSSTHMRRKLDSVIAMLNELLHHSASSVLANASARDSLANELNEIALLLDSVVSRFNNVDPTTYSNPPPRKRATLEDDSSVKTVLERLDNINETLQEYRNCHASSMDRSSDEAFNVILERLDELKLSEYLPPSSGEENIISELAAIHAKLDSLTMLCQHATECARKENVIPPPSRGHVAKSILSDPQPSMPLQRSLSVFAGRGRKRATKPVLSSAEVSDIRSDGFTLFNDKIACRLIRNRPYRILEITTWMGRFDEFPVSECPPIYR